MVNDRPVGMRALGVGASGAHFSEPGTPSTLVAQFAQMRSTDIVQAAAKLTIWLEQPGRGSYGPAQQEMVDVLFPGRMASRIRSALAVGGERGGFDALFFPGQLLALQKLGLAAGLPGPPTSFDDGELVPTFVLAAAQVNDVRDALMPVPPRDMDEVDLSIYGIRAAEMNMVRFPPSVAGRATRRYPTRSCRHQRPPGAAPTSCYAPWRSGLSGP